MKRDQFGNICGPGCAAYGVQLIVGVYATFATCLALFVPLTLSATRVSLSTHVLVQNAQLTVVDSDGTITATRDANIFPCTVNFNSQKYN